eukprot:4670253-Amphidinium_carterae.1
MPHGKKPFGPAPSSSVASANQRSWVFGFSNPDRGLPAVPVQPGILNNRSALDFCVDNKQFTDEFVCIIGPAQPGHRARRSTSRSGVATQSHYPLCAPALDERCTSGHSHPGTPAKPDALNKPMHHMHSNGQAASRGFLASDTHSTRRLHAQNQRLAHDTYRRHPNNAAPI